MISASRRYSSALVFALWSAAWLAGVNSDVLAGVFLALAAVCVVLAEKERQRLVRKERAPHHRRRED